MVYIVSYFLPFTSKFACTRFSQPEDGGIRAFRNIRKVRCTTRYKPFKYNKLFYHYYKDVTRGKLHSFFFLWRCGPMRAMASSLLRFLDHTQRRTTFGRTPLDERSARRRDLSLTTHNTHSRQTSLSPVGFEPTIAAGERPQT